MLGLASLSLFGLGLAQYWELPLTALRHGGIAFFGAFLLCLLVLALPLALAGADAGAALTTLAP
jgi:SNF family Na+-dependent transporter